MVERIKMQTLNMHQVEQQETIQRSINSASSKQETNLKKPKETENLKTWLSKIYAIVISVEEPE